MLLREFKPRRETGKGSLSEIAELIEAGEFKKAYRYCRENGYRLDAFQKSLAKMGRKMFYSRPGELASLILRYRIDVGYDIRCILRSQLNLKDYHGFLKNVHRFHLVKEFEPEVEHAMSCLNRPEEAQAWRRKFRR